MINGAWVDSVQNRAPRKGHSHYTPCYFTRAAHRTTAADEDGRARLQLFNQLMLDLGAVCSVMDIKSAKKFEARGATKVVRWTRETAIQARVVGGGHVQCRHSRVRVPVAG